MEVGASEERAENAQTTCHPCTINWLLSLGHESIKVRPALCKHASRDAYATYACQWQSECVASMRQAARRTPEVVMGCINIMERRVW